MASTVDLEKRLGVTRQTISNWTNKFADLLSPGSTPAKGQVRHYNDADIGIMASIAHYRSQKRSYADIRAELEQGHTIPAGDVPPMDIIERPEFAPVTFFENILSEMQGLYNAQIEHLQGDVESERAARLEAEKRAAIAETKADMLSNQVDQLTAEKSEKRPPAWQFWRRG